MTWPSIQISSVARIVGGSTPDTNRAEYWGGEIPWATPKDLSELDGAIIRATPRLITKAGLASCSSEILPENSVLFSSRAPIGHVAINAVPMATNQGFKSFVPDPKHLDAKFLYHWLRANKAYLQSLGNGATFKEVSKEIVSRINIPMPPIEEQRRIAAILDQAEALRAKRRQALAKLDTLTQSIFLEIFGDPIANPKKWPIRSLGAVTEFENGDRSSSYPSGNDIKTSGVLFLNGKNIVDDRLDITVPVYISRGKFDSLSRGKARNGDLIITLRGTLGNCCIFNCDSGEAFINAQMMIIRSSKYMNPDFLHALITSARFKAKFAQIGSGVAVPQLTSAQLKELPIINPPRNIQDDFALKANALSHLQSQVRKFVAMENKAFASLQHRAFRSEL